MDTFHEMAQHIERMHPKIGMIILLSHANDGYGLLHAMTQTISPYLSFKSYVQLGFLLNVAHSDLFEVVVNGLTPVEMAARVGNTYLVRMLGALGIGTRSMSEAEVATFRYEMYFERSLLLWLCPCILKNRVFGKTRLWMF